MRQLEARQVQVGRILRQWNWGLEAGETVGLSAPSGAGKTMALRVLAGLQPVDAGGVEFEGRLVKGGEWPRVRTQVMYLPQRPWWGSGTVREQLQLPLLARSHRARRWSEEAAQAFLREVGKRESLLDQDTGRLSGGEQQLLQIYRAVQLQPKVLLLDEPTSALDAEGARRVEEWLGAWQKRTQCAWVWVSHDLGQLERCCARTDFFDPGVPEDSFSGLPLMSALDRGPGLG